MDKVKQYAGKILQLAKKIDYVLVFLVLFLIMLVTGYKMIMILSAAYIYTGFYVVIKRVIQGRGVSFLHLFLIFIVGMLVVSGIIKLLEFLI